MSVLQERPSVDKILEDLRQSSTKQHDLDSDKQRITDELNRLQKDKGPSADEVITKQSELRELEKKTVLENVRYEELMLELSEAKKPPPSTSYSAASRANHIDVNSFDQSNNNTKNILDLVQKHQNLNHEPPKISLEDYDLQSFLTKTSDESENVNAFINSIVTKPSTVIPKYDFGDSDFIITTTTTSGGEDTSYKTSSIPSPLPMRIDHITPSLEDNMNDFGELSSLAMKPYGFNLSSSNAHDLNFTADLQIFDPLLELKDVEAPENRVDMLEVPGKGRCYVYISRYNYDPFQQSLNDYPESELALNGGDYILVWGDADEDGYYEGELMDGRKGLVPSNYVEKLVGEDLLEFHQSVVLGIDEEDVWSTSLPNDIPLEQEVIISPESMNCHQFEEDNHLLNATYLSPEIEEYPPDHFVGRHSQSLIGMRMEGADDSPTHLVDYEGSSVPAPKQLTLERQLNKSILIGWTPPDTAPGLIEMYHVYVDGFLRTTVRSTDKTKALVEGVDNSRPHRISVRSVTDNRKTSKDAACTMIIGKDAPLGPSCVKATNITSTAATISWLPSNSNFQHTVCINNVEVRTLKPGTYKHTITGLTPNTTYRVTVRAKNIKANPYVDEKSLSRLLEKLSAHTEFKTLNKGLPDPPMDVRVEGGPQDGTVLVTWIPVTLNERAKASPVTGYAVFADGKRVTDVDSPSSDHALVDLGCIGHFNPKFITVRSKSHDLLSNDSSAVPIAHSRTRKSAKGMDKQRFNQTGYRAGPTLRSKGRGYRGVHGSGHVILDHDEDNLSDKELFARNIPAIEITRDSASEFDQYSEDEFYPRDQRRMGMRRRPPRRHPHKESYRTFVALFDYDPPTMSPNPEACDEELPFREGQLIKVIGEKDADGFYWGECGNKQGYVPCNMVSEVQVDDDRTARDLFKEDASRYPRGSGRLGRFNDTQNTPVRKMIALYDYDPQKLSPNVDAEVELSFHTGEIIFVYGDMDDDGFYMAELKGQRGLVPSNFLTDAPASDFDQKNLNRSLGPGAAGPPPPPRGQQQPKGESSLMSKLSEKVFHTSSSQNQPKPQAQTKTGGLVQNILPSLGKKPDPPPPQHQQQVQASGHVDLDKIPGLDDDFDMDFQLPKPAVTAGMTATTPRTPAGRPGAMGAKPGQEQPAEGGLLGGITSGLTSGLGSITGGAAKLGDLAGSASSAGGGLLKAGGGLFKKFGF